MKSFDFLKTFYGAKHDQDSILSDLSRVLASESADVRMIPFGCEQESVDWFDQRISATRHVSLVQKQGRLYEFQLDFTFKQSEQQSRRSGRFFILQHPDYLNVFVALTIEPSVFYDRALMPFLSGLYPKIMLTFITHKKLRRLIEDFKTRGGYDQLIITRASQRLRHQEGPNLKHVIPVVSWPQMSLDEAFEWVHQNNGWFQSIEFDVISPDRTLASILVTRQGIVRANALLNRAFTAFTLPVCKTIHENITLFSKRSRLARRDLSTAPLAIGFDTDQFNELEENKRLVRAMQKLRTASVSVLHGNPYVHLTVLDYFDRSINLKYSFVKRPVSRSVLAATVSAS